MGIGDDKKILHHDYEDMDAILVGYIDLGMTPKQIAKEHDMQLWDIGTKRLDPIWRVVDVILKYRASEHMSNPKEFDAGPWQDINYRNCVDINQPYKTK